MHNKLKSFTKASGGVWKSTNQGPKAKAAYSKAAPKGSGKTHASASHRNLKMNVMAQAKREDMGKC